MTDQQNRPLTTDEQFKMLFDHTAKLNDAVSALLAPEWGSENGIIPAGHPLYVREKQVTQEQDAPVDWQAIVRARERELKQVGEARHQAEQQVRRLGLMVDEYAAGAGHLTDKIKRVRAACDQLHRASVLADGEPHTDHERGILQAVRRVLTALDPPAAADNGPTVAECAEVDRRWPLQKAGE